MKHLWNKWKVPVAIKYLNYMKNDARNFQTYVNFVFISSSRSQYSLLLARTNLQEHVHLGKHKEIKRTNYWMLSDYDTKNKQNNTEKHLEQIIICYNYSISGAKAVNRNPGYRISIRKQPRAFHHALKREH